MFGFDLRQAQVDARNVRNIVLMRPVGSMIEFKQIIGRGTRLFDGKDYFTIYDFVKAYEHFNDSEWDGEPLEPVVSKPPKPGKPEGEGTRDDNGSEPEGGSGRRRSRSSSPTARSVRSKA
jgi:type I restriction enzyme, R subunit